MSAVMHQHPQFQEPQPWTGDIYRKRMVCMMICTHQDWFRVGDLDWITRNYHVWEAFEREADRIWARGRRRYSARTIIEVLRHESLLREGENVRGWKINNNAVPGLERLYMLMHPDRDGFFEKRSGQSAVRAI